MTEVVPATAAAEPDAQSSDSDMSIVEVVEKTKKRKSLTPEEVAAARGTRFDQWVGLLDTWVDAAPGRREQYIRSCELWCVFCRKIVVVTVDNTGNFTKHTRGDVYVLSVFFLNLQVQAPCFMLGFVFITFAVTKKG